MLSEPELYRPNIRVSFVWKVTLIYYVERTKGSVVYDMLKDSSSRNINVPL